MVVYHQIKVLHIKMCRYNQGCVNTFSKVYDSKACSSLSRGGTVIITWKTQYLRKLFKKGSSQQRRGSNRKENGF